MSKSVFLTVKDRRTGEDIRDVIMSAGMQARLFESPESMINSLSAGESPSLILVDLHTPDLNGWQICTMLRSAGFSHLSQTHIMILSSVLPDFCLSSISEHLGADGFISLPAKPAQILETIRKSTAEAPYARQPIVLLVDDDRHSSDFIATGLKSSGYHVVVAADAAEALRQFEEVTPSILILDHLLPNNSTALELVPKLLPKMTNPLSVAIAITASEDTDVPSMYLKAGADGYIKKPFSINYLLTTIHRAQHDRMFSVFEKVIEDRTASLKETEGMLRDLYENAPVGYHTLSGDGTILSMNQTELRWLGYSEQEVIGKKIFDLQSESSSLRGLEAFEELKETGSIADLELLFIKKDGSSCPVRLDACAVLDKNGKISSIRSIARNVTEQKALESSLAHAQKMESTAILSDGIAHNFNNLLTPVLANAVDLLETMQLNDDEREALQDIVASAKKGAQLVKQLGQLKRTPFAGRSVFSLGWLVKETLSLLRETVDKTYTFSFEDNDSELMIEGNVDQVRQALINLCLNSKDAMPDGGPISLKLEQSSRLNDPRLHIAHRQRSYAVISVSDAGEGIPLAVQNKIFDAFFTTRGLASHSGLGLTIAYSLIRDHDGFINIESQPGRGTRALIYLPVTDAKKPMRPEHSENNPGTPEKNDSRTAGEKRDRVMGTILLVDDETVQLRTATRILEHAGYEVVPARSPSSAFELLKSNTSSSIPRGNKTPRIDLIILDLVFPGESGERFLPEIRTAAGNIPVIVVSGSTDRTRATRLFSLGVTSVITKPYDGTSLLRTVSVALGSAPAKGSING